MNFRIWKPIVLLGLLGACSETAEPSAPDGARETGYLRCQTSAACTGTNEVSCVDAGGRSTCVDAPSSCATFDCACAGSLCGGAACTDLPGEAIACAISGPPATCVGVSVERPEGTYCVVPDGDEFACPADASVRTSQRGAAICRAESVPALTAESADIIAIQALRTGQILLRADVTDVVIRSPQAYTAPGVPAGSVITVELALQSTLIGEPFDSLNSGVRPGDGPEPCHVTVDHLTQTLVDHTFQVRAWHRVTCGEAPADAFRPPTPFVELVPPEAGVYRVHTRPEGGPEYYTQNMGRPLVVALGNVCETPPPIDECAVGFLFADCGGSMPPMLWCQNTASRSCLWFSGGCPAAEFSLAADCTGARNCLSDSPNRGTEPWDRQRAMVVTVEVDATLVAPDAVAVSCTCDAPPCMDEVSGLCDPSAPAPARYETDLGADMFAARSGMFVFTVQPFAEEGFNGLSGIFLVTEVDLEAAGGPRARACLFDVRRDGTRSVEPVCATSGSLVLDRLAATPADAAAAHGTAVLEFESAPLQSGPLRIDLAF